MENRAAWRRREKNSRTEQWSGNRLPSVLEFISNTAGGGRVPAGGYWLTLLAPAPR